MKLNAEKLLTWSMRLIALYIFSWWAILYLGYASLEPLGIKDIFAALFLGTLHSTGIFLASINQQKLVLYLGTMPLIAIALYLFINSLLSKVLIVDVIGIVGCILCVIHILKTNKIGGWKWQISLR